MPTHYRIRQTISFWQSGQAGRIACNTRKSSLWPEWCAAAANRTRRFFCFYFFLYFVVVLYLRFTRSRHATNKFPRAIFVPQLIVTWGKWDACMALVVSGTLRIACWQRYCRNFLAPLLPCKIIIARISYIFNGLIVAAYAIPAINSTLAHSSEQNTTTMIA